MRGTYIKAVWQHNPHLYAPKRYRKACSYDAFVPDAIRDLDVRIEGTLAAAVAEAEGSIAALNAGPTSHLAPLARLLLRTESIASSKVEGLQVDAHTLARAEAKQESGRPASAVASEILASIDAMQLAIERATEPRALSAPDLAAIHDALLRDVTPEIAGKIRTVQNWIGGNNYNPCGAHFVPPPPEHVAALLADLCDFCNDDRFSPLMQAAIAHAQFETIHPFADGNGRTGRALVQFVLRRTGLAPAYVPPISVVLARDKEAYIDGLTAFRMGDVDTWFATFSDAAGEAAHLARRYLGEVQALQEQWRASVADTASAVRADAGVWPLIDALPAHPIVTVNIAMASTGRTRPAMAHAIERLVAAEVLQPVTSSPRNRAWEPAGLYDIIAGLESGRA